MPRRPFLVGSVMSGEDKDLVTADLQELESVPLLEDDGEPLETPWHRDCMILLIDSTHARYRGRADYYVGGNMFLYYSVDQAKNKDYRGPDFFFVAGARLHPPRRHWAIWKENGRYPDVIIELLSPTTAQEDLTTKKNLYEQIFRTTNYFCYDPFEGKLLGWELNKSRYEPLAPNERGRLWCSVLGVWVGTWEGEIKRQKGVWLRFFDEKGEVVATAEEEAEQAAEVQRLRGDELEKLVDKERERADKERERAEAAEAELARLRALLTQQPPSAPPAG
jgi:Uma2 family endonuclease